MFTLRENMLFCEQWTRSFELESVLGLFFRGKLLQDGRSIHRQSVFTDSFSTIG
jgi:hypothetical protein